MFSSLITAGGATIDADDDDANVTDEIGDGRLATATARTADVDVEVDPDAVGIVTTTADVDVGAVYAIVAAAEDDGTAA